MKSVQQISAKKEKQASRSKPVPSQLAELLELANSIGWDGREEEVEERLPFPEDVEPDEYFAHFKALMDEGFPEKEFPRFRQFLDQVELTDTFSDFLFYRVGIFERWRFVLEVREVLQKIDENNRWEEVWKPIKFRDNLTEVKKDENGRLKVFSSLIITALDGVEVDRIRRCSVCFNLFWAGRKDKPCCTVKCAKILRTRKWRKKAIDYQLQRANKDRAQRSE